MNGVLVGRVRGIEIRIGWSVAIIAWLLAWSLASEVLPDMAEGRTDGEYWTAAAVATLGFLAALFAHELGHSVVAQSYGLKVRSITLWMLGGVARFEKMAEDPDAAMRIAAAGPAVSVACAVVGLVAAALAGDGLIAAVLLWFGSINLLLAVFNLLPAFPLDGGRIYQARLRTKGLSPDRATAKASRLGVIIGQVIVWLGVVEILLAGLLGGLWLMAIGWFIREASLAEAQATVRATMLGHVAVREVMAPDPIWIPPTRSLQRFVDEVLETGRHAAYPVVDDGLVVGLMELKALRTVPRTTWSATAVGSVMRPLSDLPVAAPDDGADVLAQRMEEHGGTRALVLDHDRLVGIVSPSDLARLTIALELAQGTDLGVP